MCGEVAAVEKVCVCRLQRCGNEKRCALSRKLSCVCVHRLKGCSVVFEDGLKLSKLFPEESKVPGTLLETRKVAGSATYKQSITVEIVLSFKVRLLIHFGLSLNIFLF